MSNDSLNSKINFVGYLPTNSLEETVNAGVEVNAVFSKLNESIGSEKRITKRLGSSVSKPITVGSSKSGVLSKTLFCTPGVPPLGSTLALQLSEEEQRSSGLMRSILHPSPFLRSSLYQASV